MVIVRVGANACGLIFTGPAYGVDFCLSSIKTVVFGEPVPIIKDRRLFLFNANE